MKPQARQKTKAPTRKMLVQAAASLLVTLVAGAFASYAGVEIAGEVRSALEVLAASAVAALVPMLPAWIMPPSPADGVEDVRSGRPL